MVWNLAFWVATMHSVELGLGVSIGASVLFTVFRTIATKLKHKGECHHYLHCALSTSALTVFDGNFRSKPPQINP